MNKILQEQYEETLRQNAALIEQNKKLLSKLEIAEHALLHLAENAVRLHTLSGVESYARGTLQQLRE